MADDHRILLEGLKTTLAKTTIEVVGYTTDSDMVLAEYKSLKPDVVLCDIKFGADSDNGFTVLKNLLNYDPDAKVIIFSQFDQDTLIQQSYDEGAKCFLMKSVHRDELIEAISRVYKGEIYFTPEISNRLALNSVLKLARDRTAEELLSEREKLLLKYFGEGLSDDEVANLIQSSTSYATKQKALLKDKLGVTKNADLTRIAIKLGLVGLDP